MVHAANGDITAYLPTNIMSITDGQWIMDMEIFRSGVRPALNIGLSVTRAGGIGHTKRQKALAAETLKILATYRQAEEFSHFGSELAADAKRALAVGKSIFEALTQGPTDTYSLMSQQLIFDIILHLSDGEEVDVNALKVNVAEFADQVNSDEDFDKARDGLKAKCLIAHRQPEPVPTPENTPPPETDKKDDKAKHKEESKKEKVGAK
jgi:F-type H+-transporting ATPase subunit alpha